MALLTKTVTIGSDVYEITQLKTSDGLPIYSRLLKVLGPMVRATLADPAIVGGVKASTEGSDAVSGAAGIKIANVVLQGFESLETAFLLELADTFKKVTKVQLMAGGPMVDMAAGDIFDQHFAGRYAQLTKWLLAHLHLNFTDFLAGLASAGARSQAAAP